jgi:hypothetical protein
VSARRKCASPGKAGLAARFVGGVTGCINGCSAMHYSTSNACFPTGAPEGAAGA